MLTKVKRCKSGIDHTSNGYYYAVMDVRTIFCLRQERSNHIEAYYRVFEAAISMAEMEEYNATTHKELNKAYADGDDEDRTKSFQTMCLIMSAYLDR